MFALAPSLVASPNETLMSTNEADFSLPATFVEETLRVAVYAEDNTTLPSYATGGVYTDYSANIISLLESEGYAVTALTTQNILDHQLMAADFDTFVLANQLPKDNIINLVKDYWLAGGSILSFGGSIGFCFYTGMIDSSLAGGFQLAPIASPGYWAYSDVPLSNVSIMQRHPITQDYQVSDSTLMPAGNYTVFNGIGLDGIIGDEFIPLVRHNYSGLTPVASGFDNPAQGGKIVHLPGNCSTIPSWLNPMITESIDWLAPRPKANIAIDYTHHPFYGVDSWDENVSNIPRYNLWRDYAVSHSFTFDKLYPKASNELTAADIAPFDVLVLNLPYINYTTAEMTVIQTWVENGGGLYVMADAVWTDSQLNLNELLSDWGLAISQGFANLPTDTTSEFVDHPVLEGVSVLSFHTGEYLNISGDAYPIVNFSSNIALAGAEAGNGRVILAGDINFLQATYIGEEDNVQFSINILNWLSSGPAKVLVYADISSSLLHPNIVPLNGPVAQSLNNLGIPFFMTSNKTYFNMSLFRDDWDMVVFDNTMWTTTSYQPHLVDFVADGGKLLFSTWKIDATTGAYFGVELANALTTLPTVYLYESSHPIFNIPAFYGSSTIESDLNILGTDGLNYTTFANATPLAGFTATEKGAAIALGADGKVIVNGAALTLYYQDTDNSTYPDNVELWTNQIAFMYYDRPTINHPDDVTYMETETGNEISWTATADAGAWEYIVKENGSIIETGLWNGGAITINVDGVNASLTDYQLTVFDRLGYSASDLVVLNVTEYVEPTTTTTTGTGTPLDPMLLLLIGVGAVVVIVIIIIVMKKKK